ncbi:MAG: TerB family tellurite resistance protein [Mesorhizobium sp.]|nr:TerB family tellurite resistance protein [Mesorhizobium sp.]MCO5161662.1 TerB family tellurite resistance protein [Mesorhizobium sp.]
MFERFLAFLRELTGEDAAAPGLGSDHPAVAAAALLFLVMDADGERAESERRILEEEIAATYDVHGETLAQVIAAGEKAEQESVDLYVFTSVLNQHLDQKGRIEFVAMMWEIVFADGVRTELEDNIVWRVAELLHVERADRIRLRREIEQRLPDTAGKENEVETD